jgi:signal peptidase I
MENQAEDNETTTIPSEASDGGMRSTKASGKAPDSRWKRRGRVLWLEWVKPLSIIGLVMFSFRSAVADWNDVPTGSMKPTILEGDRIFINKVAYDLKFPFTTWRLAQWEDPAWGDVVVLRSPEDSKRLVKRVVGLPGDLIEVNGNNLYRNGQPAVYSPLPADDFIYMEKRHGERFYEEDVDGREHPILLAGNPLHPPAIPAGCESQDEDYQKRRSMHIWTCRVGEGQFFVMGDNRNNSRDSRYFGPVDRANILGQATAVALSLDLNDHYKPRWGRFFSELP